MLTVPTTPRASNFDPPGPGGWTGVCLGGAVQSQTEIPMEKSAGMTRINETIGSHPGRRPASINP